MPQELDFVPPRLLEASNVPPNVVIKSHDFTVHQHQFIFELPQAHPGIIILIVFNNSSYLQSSISYFFQICL